MLVKFNISNYTLIKEALEPLCALAYQTISDYVDGQKADKQIKKALQERAYYNVPVAVLHGAFKSRYANSQQQSYLNLKNDINVAVSTLFNNHSVSVVSTDDNGVKHYEIKSAYEIDAQNAVKLYMQTVRRIYDRRIERAILNGKSTINLISNSTLINYFKKSMRSISNREVVQDVASTIHSIWYEIQKSGIDYNQFTNDYTANLALLRSFWYDCKITKYKFTDRIDIRPDGIYTKRSDGAMRVHCRFRSHIFGGEYFTDNYYFSTDKNGNVFVNVLQYRSLYEALFNIANKCIDENRRSYTSTKKEVQDKNENTSVIDSLDYIHYDEKGYINIEENEKEVRKLIMSTLLENGVKHSKAIPFCNALLLHKVEGMRQDEACKNGGISHVTYIKYWKLYKELIGKALLAHRQGKA